MRLSTRPVLAAAFVALIAGGFAVIPRAADAADVTQGFETSPPTGWTVVNRSTPAGNAGFSNGVPGTGTNTSGIPAAQAGAANSFAVINYSATSATTATGGTIDDWLVTPSQATLSNGDTWSIYTQTPAASDFPDRLQVRLSTNGSCTPDATNGGTGAFTTLLFEVNPTLAVGGYPETWTQLSGTLSGLPAGNSTGCLAFRYYVTDGGVNGNNSNLIGLDTYSFVDATATGTATPTVTPTVTPTPSPTVTATGPTQSPTATSTGTPTNTNPPTTPAVTVPPTTATATTTVAATTTATATATTTTRVTSTVTPTPTATATVTATATATTTTTAAPPAPVPPTVTVTASPSAQPSSTCAPALANLSAAQRAAAATQAKALKLKAKAKVSTAPAQKAKATVKAKKAKAAAAAAQVALSTAKSVVGTSCR